MGFLKAERLEIVSCIMNIVQVFGKIRWTLPIKKNILNQFSRNSNHLSRKNIDFLENLYKQGYFDTT